MDISCSLKKNGGSLHEVFYLYTYIQVFSIIFYGNEKQFKLFW